MPAPKDHTHNALDLVWGTLPAARFPALTGDVTSVAGTVATTLVATPNTIIQGAVFAGPPRSPWMGLYPRINFIGDGYIKPSTSLLEIVAPSVYIGTEGNCDFGGSGATGYALRSKVDLLNTLGEASLAWLSLHTQSVYLRSTVTADGFYTQVKLGRDLTASNILTFTPPAGAGTVDLQIDASSKINQDLLTSSTTAAFAKLTVDNLSLDGTTLASTAALTLISASGSNIVLSTGANTGHVVTNWGVLASHVVYHNQTQIAISDTLTNLIAQWSLTAGSDIAAGQGYRFRVWGTFAGDATKTVTFTIKFTEAGATTVSTPLDAVGFLTATDWIMEGEFVYKSASVQDCWVRFSSQNAGATVFTSRMDYFTGAKTWANGITFDIQGVMSAALANGITVEGSKVWFEERPL